MELKTNIVFRCNNCGRVVISSKQINQFSGAIIDIIPCQYCRPAQKKLEEAKPSTSTNISRGNIENCAKEIYEQVDCSNLSTHDIADIMCRFFNITH